jgi:hypothetical protein
MMTKEAAAYLCSGLEIFPAVRAATRRLQAHLGPSLQQSKITRRRRI